MNRTEAAEKQWIEREQADRAQERKWAEQRDAVETRRAPAEPLPERALICPRCTKLLELRNVSGVELHGCDSCAGSWLEADQLAALMKKRDSWWQRARRALRGARGAGARSAPAGGGGR